MKQFLFMVCFLSTTKLFAQQTFSVFTYTEPKGFSKEVSTGNISYTLMDNKKGTYCMINLLGAINSSGDIQTEFNTEWNKNVAAKNKMIDVLQMDVPKKVNGWDAITGGQNFTLGKRPTMALQTTFVGFGKTADVLIYMNDDSYLKYATDFLQKVSLNKPQTIVKQNNNNTTTAPILNNNAIDNEYKNANETTGTGAVSDYSFVLPNNWQVQNNPDRIIIEPKDHNFYTPTISILPITKSSGNLETDMNGLFFQVWAGYKMKATTRDYYNDYFQKGKTLQGFPYYMERRSVIKDGETESIDVGLLLVQLQGRVAIVAIFKASSLFNLDELGYLLFTLRFSKEKSLANSLSQDIIGGWGNVGGSTASSYTYYKDGSFSKGGATSIYSSHDANYDKVTTTSFGASGTFSIKGNTLSEYYKSNNTTYKSKLRFYYKKLGDKDWEFKMSKLNVDNAPEYGIPIEIDKDK
jgi:hypothetical protein